MTPPDPKELPRYLLEFIRFMIHDHAFSEEFLVTCVQEYFQNNGPDKPEKL